MPALERVLLVCRRSEVTFELVRRSRRARTENCVPSGPSRLMATLMPTLMSPSIQISFSRLPLTLDLDRGAIALHSGDVLITLC